MRIGIVIPAFNVAPFIGDALASLVRQTHAEWRAIVVDDGSQDDTIGAASRCLDPRVQIEAQPHAGVSAARNHGLAGLDADAILFLDADDWLAADALGVLAKALADAPWAVAAVGSYARVRPSSGSATVGQPPASGDLLAGILVRNPFANGGHLLIARDAVESAGPFRVDLSYGEDWEFWTRLGLQGEFVRATSAHPICFVRERPGSTYLRLASDPAAFEACMRVAFTNPDLLARFGETGLRALCRAAEAEKAWVVGRELIRHGRCAEGRGWLRRSVAGAPSLKRRGLLAASACLDWLPEAWRGPFRPYQTTDCCERKARHQAGGTG